MIKKLTFSLTFSFFTTLLVAQLNMGSFGSRTYPNEKLNDVWGYADSLGNEYALVGTRKGFSILDVTDPVNGMPELFYRDGFNSTWRDIKTWKHYAYVTTDRTQDGTGFGLLIVDMSTLATSDTIASKYYTGVNYPFQSAHNLYIDENGYCYVFGANYSEGGAIILDLSQDPWNPTEAGLYDEYYFHDGVVRGDTLWGSAVYDGITIAADVTSKTNPVTMAAWDTPSEFSHNVWVSDDGNYVFTTDEVSNAYVASYDVSDLSNVVELDRYQSSPGENVIPHNTHYYDKYLVTSYYRDGVTIVDANHPYNLIEVGNYDTSPLSGDGFNGCWGAYPYLPSGNILATDMEEGLFVLFPIYKRGCYLEGFVTDGVCGANLDGVKVEILGTDIEKFSLQDGAFNTGYHTLGTYTIRFSKFGYETKEVTGVTLTNGQTTNLDVELVPVSSAVDLAGIVQDAQGNSVEGVSVVVYNEAISYNFITDASGNFERCGIPSGTYEVSVSKWGYKPVCLPSTVIDASNTNLSYSLIEGYEDNFENDLGWVVETTASSGDWERGIPNGSAQDDGTLSNPDTDAATDCGEKAYITGNNMTNNPWEDDIDDGITVLKSPLFNVDGYGSAQLSFSHWFSSFNSQGNNPLNDYMDVKISDGNQTVTLMFRDATSTMSEWLSDTYTLSDYVNTTLPLQLIVTAVDIPEGNITEAGFDDFKVFDAALSQKEVSTKTNVIFYPNPSSGLLNYSFANATSTTKYIQIRNILGEVVLQEPIISMEGQINSANGLATGTYQVSVYDNNIKVATQKWIKY